MTTSREARQSEALGRQAAIMGVVFSLTQAGLIWLVLGSTQLTDPSWLQPGLAATGIASLAGWLALTVWGLTSVGRGATAGRLVTRLALICGAAAVSGAALLVALSIGDAPMAVLLGAAQAVWALVLMMASLLANPRIN